MTSSNGLRVFIEDEFVEDDRAALAALVIAAANQISYELGRLSPDRQ